MIERTVTSRRLCLLIVSIALTVAACAQGALPPADLSTAPAPAPTPTAEPRSTVASLPASEFAETESTGDRSDVQPAVIESPAPPTDDSWEDVTTNLVGLDSTCGNVSYVSSNPKRAQVIVGISSHGLFEFDSETVSWNAMGSGAGSAFINNRMGWIEYDPIVPERFWQAGAYGDGVFRTDDNGLTFSRLGEIAHLDFVSVDPTDPFRAVMMAGVHEDAVVYRSEDGGATWQDLSAELPQDVGATSYPVVFDASTHLLGTHLSDTSGIFRSEDAGATWTQTHEGAIAGPPIVDGGNVFWLLERGGGVVRSSNEGFSFEAGDRTGGQPSTLAQLSDGRLVTHNAESLLISDDLGASWTQFGPPLLYNPNGVSVSEDGNAVFAWRFSCNRGDEDNSVQSLSILRLGADFG